MPPHSPPVETVNARLNVDRISDRVLELKSRNVFHELFRDHRNCLWNVKIGNLGSCGTCRQAGKVTVIFLTNDFERRESYDIILSVTFRSLHFLSHRQKGHIPGQHGHNYN